VNGLAVSFREKTNIAKCLDELGVDAIELAAIKCGKEDCIINRTIASTVKNAVVAIPVGFSCDEVDEAWECVKEAAHPCLQVVVPTSTVQMEYLFHIKDAEMSKKVAELVAYSRSKCECVDFVATDASRANPDFLVKVCKIAQENGASSVTLCDDAGVLSPRAFGDMVSDVKTEVTVPVYVAPSDAIHMAAATAMEAIAVGADGVKTTIADPNTLQIGHFADAVRVLEWEEKIECSLDQTGIHRAVSVFSGKTVPSAEPEIKEEETAILLGSESSLSDIAKAVAALGYEISDEDNGRVYEEFKRLIQRKQSVDAKELEAIVASAAMQVPSTYHVENYVCNNGSAIKSMAYVSLLKDGVAHNGMSTGDGPIDASFRAIEQAIGHHYELDDFQIQSVTEGREALGSALVKLRSDGKLYSGNGLSTDIVGASIRAYINALNKIVYEEEA
jgi:2-isopropylmalate synthase